MNRKKIKNPILFRISMGIAVLASLFLFPAPYFMTRGTDLSSFFLVLFYIIFPFLSSIFAKIMVRIFYFEGEEKEENTLCLLCLFFYIVWPIWALVIAVYQVFNFNSRLGNKIADKLTQNSKETKMLEYEKLRLELKEMGVEV